MNRVLTVSAFTFRELLRSKLLYVWLLSMAALCGLGYLLAILSFGDSVRIFMDLGLVGMEISGLMVLVLALAVTYNTEMDQKAIFLQLTKPLTKGEYLLGRILGFYLVIALVMVGMALAVLGLAVFVGGAKVSPLFLDSALFLLAEMFVLTVLGLCFQMIATSMVGVVVYTIFTVFLGHFTSDIQWILKTQIPSLVKLFLQGAFYCLPNLEVFNLKDRLYDPNLSLAPIPWSDMFLYTFAYSFAVFLIGWINLEKREFK